MRVPSAVLCPAGPLAGHQRAGATLPGDQPARPATQRYRPIPTRIRPWLPALVVALGILLAAWLLAGALAGGVGAPAASGASPAAPSGPAGLAPMGATQRAIVERVVDGDTLIVDLGGDRQRVRAIGIDSPELTDDDPQVRAMAQAGADALARLVAGREVLLERDVSDTDRFGRLLRYVWVDDGASSLEFVNLRLIADGHARVVTFPPDVAWHPTLLAAQDAAREAGLGLWVLEPGD
jgi:micrococcal nuclease